MRKPLPHRRAARPRGDVVAKLIEADCVDGLFQFLRTRGFAMGSEGSGAKRIHSTDWRDPTPTDNEKKVYRQMQETRRVLHLAAQHRSVNCLQLLLDDAATPAPPTTCRLSRESSNGMPTTLSTCPTRWRRGTRRCSRPRARRRRRKTVDALKVLINAKADVDAGFERGHRWESVHEARPAERRGVRVAVHTEARRRRRPRSDAGEAIPSGLHQGGAREEARRSCQPFRAAQADSE